MFINNLIALNTINIKTSSVLSSFLGNEFYFGFPGNDSMFSLIILFLEVFYIGASIIYLILEIFFKLVDKFVNTKKKAPSHFTPEMESFLDIFFLTFPTAIILYILIPTLGYLYAEELNPDSIFSMTISITGHQWYWSYDYNIPGYNKILQINCSSYQKISFDAIMLDIAKVRLLTTDHTVIFPTFTRILLQLTSDDVIHSWAVPQLGIKLDAIPGRVASAILYTDVSSKWFGQCSELCGALHGFMPITLHSVSAKTFFKWYISSDLELFNTNVLNFNSRFKIN